MENLTQLRNINDIILLLSTGIIGAILFLVIMNFIYNKRYSSPEDYLKYLKRR